MKIWFNKLMCRMTEIWCSSRNPGLKIETRVQPLKTWFEKLMWKMASYIQVYSIRHSLKSGPEALDLGPWDPRLWNPGPWDLGSWGSGTGTLGHRTLTPGTLVMGSWDPVTSNWPPPQIVLTLFVRLILIIKS